MVSATAARPAAVDAWSNVVRGTAAIIGVVLLVIGLSGFFGFGLAGNPDTHPLFITGLIQDLAHIITGSLALYVAFGLSGRQQAAGLVLLGTLFVVILLATLNDGDLYGLLQNVVNPADNVLHGVIALVSIGVGGWALLRGRSGSAPSEPRAA
jgi:hypothetical protein